MTALTDLKTGRIIDLDDKTIHKYWKPQGVWHGYIFIMEEDFNMDYEGFAVNVKQEKGGEQWVLFWKETVQKYGEFKDIVPGKFRDKPFIRMLVSKHDGIEQA